jgi:hypothetical protein
VAVFDAQGALERQVALPKDGGVFTDLAVDPAGTLYALDAVGAVVWSAGRGDAAFKPLTQGMKDRMSFPSQLTTSRGKLYLVDQNGSGLVVISADGAYQGRLLALGWSDGLLYYPGQVCVSEAGGVFVADRGNNRVQLFSMLR